MFGPGVERQLPPAFGLWRFGDGEVLPVLHSFRALLATGAGGSRGLAGRVAAADSLPAPRYRRRRRARSGPRHRVSPRPRAPRHLALERSPRLRTSYTGAMSGIVLDGKAYAKELEAELKIRVERLLQSGAQPPILATILVGDDPAS